MQYTRPRTTCKLCPFADHKRVRSELTADGLAPRIAIIGEAPDREEDRDGKPLAGPASGLVNWALANCSIPRSNVYVMNAINCYPTDGKLDSLETSEALSYCHAGALDELSTQYDRGLRVVVAMGQNAMSQLGLEGKIATHRGSVMQLELSGGRVLTVIPTYNQHQVLNHNWKRSNGGTAKAAVEWLADWKKAARIASEGGSERTALRELFNLNPSPAEVERYVDDAIRNDSLVAVDIETSGLGYDNCVIVVVGLAVSAENAMCVPFLRERGESVYTGDDWDRVRAALRRLFATCRQVYQNSFFDVPRLRNFGFPIPYKLIAHDTMILHHTLAAEAPHDLGYIVSMYGKTPYWKSEFKNRSGTIYEMNQLEMRRYNLRDCVVLHQCLETMLRDLKELSLESVYYDEALPLVEPVMEMTQYGVAINLGRVQKYKEMLESHIEAGSKELYAMASLPPEFSVSSTAQMRWFLYGEPIAAFAKIDERDTKRIAKSETESAKLTELRGKIAECNEKLVATREAGKAVAMLEKRLASLEAKLAKQLTPKAQTQIDRDIEALRVVRDQVKPIYVLPNFTPPTTDSGLLATDREGLLSYKIALVARRAKCLEFKRKDANDEVAAIDSLLAFMEKLGEIGLYRKLLSTYTKFYPWNDGRIHPYWKLHGTASGRLACVAGATQIQTNRGLFYIANYEHQQGDTILTHTGEKHRITRLYRNGIRPVMSLTLDSGPDIMCTTDHRFLTPEGWKSWSQLSLGSEVFYVSVTNSPELGRNLQTSLGSLPRRLEETNSSSSGKDFGDIRAHDVSNTQEMCESFEAENRTSLEVLSVKDGEAQSELWEERRRKWELERDMLRQQGALYGSTRLETSLYSQDSIRRSSWGCCRKVAEESDGASHRWESSEQHDRQSGALHECRASEATPKVGRVVSRSFVGTLPVFDLEVEGDHSYVAEGFIVHNCTAPNLQNLPRIREDSEDIRNPIRSFFVAPSGSQLISADYVNLEAQLLAYSTLEPELVDVFTHGLNLHDVNTASLFGVSKESPDWKSCRSAAKIDFFGNKCYGGSDSAIYRKIMLEVPDLRLTLQQYEEINKRWFKAHPLYTAWANRVRAEVRAKRRATTPFGRTRFFLDNDRDIEKEALNHMIQSSGASLVNRAMVRIEHRFRTECPRAHIVLQIHDELVAEAPDRDVELATRIIVEEMSKPFEFLGFTRSIPVDATTGIDLGKL